MKFKTMAAGLLTSVMLTGGAFAQEIQLEWWDFLGGGDGVRMKTLIEEFNAEHAGKIKINATTLEWGTPFYTKVQTSAAVGEGPDLMTYHLSRLPLGVEGGALSELTTEELAAAGLASSDFGAANWQAAQVDGKTYAVPFDIHAIVLYYNKDILGKAGLLDANGLPTGLDGVENFSAALAKVKEAGAEQGVSFQSAGDGTNWRIFYSLLGQQGGTFLDADGQFLSGDNLGKAQTAVQTMADWVSGGYALSNVEYPASVAAFTGGKAAFHINGVWEVPTMVDLHAKGELFEWGAIELPMFFTQKATWADSHAFAIPANPNGDDPATRAAALQAIAWMNKHSTFWATAGHIPAYNGARETEEFKTMQPNATYSVLADTAFFDPSSPLAGVASPTYAAIGNFVFPAISGEMTAQEAVEGMRDDLQSQAY
jgi:multiple sugar transport system substrate-binding protein